MAGGSIGLGAVYGGLRSKIFASKTRSRLHYPYYVLSVGLFLVAGYAAIKYKKELFSSNDKFAIFIWSGAILVAIGLFFVTKMYLVLKDIYKTSELDPIVNNFTASANKDEIKLFGRFKFPWKQPARYGQPSSIYSPEVYGLSTSINLMCNTAQ
jgi:hypothetical protein